MILADCKAQAKGARKGKHNAQLTRKSSGCKPKQQVLQSKQRYRKGSSAH